MNYRERPLVFECEGDQLLGIVATPDQHGTDTGVLIVVGGPQYRVGSHRQFTLLARYLAAQGVSSFRFDYRGMGDSEGDPRGFESLFDDLASASQAFLDACPQMRQVVIWGLCDAASAALLYGRGDRRVAGLVLANPWVHTERRAARSRLKHYYIGRLLQRSFWEKLLSGDISIARALGDLFWSTRQAFRGGQATAHKTCDQARSRNASRGEDGMFVDNMLAGLARFRGPVLFILSGNDLVAAEFSDLISRDKRWKRACSRGNVRILRLAGATHTFSSAVWRDEVAEKTLGFVEALDTGSMIE